MEKVLVEIIKFWFFHSVKKMSFLTTKLSAFIKISFSNFSFTALGVGFSGSYSGIEYDGNATHNPDGTPIPGRCSIHHHRHRNGGGDIEIDKASYAANKLVADIRQLLTLKQHYYPEGNWGWVIVFVSVLVQILTHGLQVGSGVLTQEIVNKFGKQIMLPAGMCVFTFLFFIYV